MFPCLYCLEKLSWKLDTSVAAASVLFNDIRIPKTMLPVLLPSISSPKIRMTSSSGNLLIFPVA